MLSASGSGQMQPRAEFRVVRLEPADSRLGGPVQEGDEPVPVDAVVQHPLKLTLMLSASGSGQMQPLPMNEFLQETLKQNCGSGCPARRIPGRPA
jgi:hypothetical protein